jgi:glycosyltransferase involved in cell wall biosynthesis
MTKNLLMITGLGAAEGLAQGKHNALYSTLQEFHKHWDRIDIVVPKVKNQTIREIFSNVHIHASPVPLLFHPLFFVAKIVSLSRQIHFDLMTVHEFPPFYNGIGARIVSGLIGIPYVLEIMHVPGVPRASGLKEHLYRWLFKVFIAFDARPARAVRVINQKQTRDFLVKAGVPVGKIQYIPAFYIDLEVFKTENIEKKYDLVYAARLEPNKGILNLLKAVKILRENKSDLKLCVIGDGPLRGELERYIKQNQLQTNVEFSGWLKGPEDVARVFNQSRVFVNPSLNEGGPRVALEAMACGVPVVTTPVGLMVDIIKDNENGLVCDWSPENMAEKISEMLGDAGLRERCSGAGRLLVQKFERKTAIADYAHALEKLSRKRLLVITQKVNAHDQLLGFFIEWLRRLGEKTDLQVLCLEKGEFDLPGIPVESLGKEKGNSKLSQAWDFYRYVIKNSDKYDAVFVHMNPIWAVLGGWYWRLADKKIILWYTHKSVTLKLRFASWFANVILTASKESFRLKSNKVVVTGHGIDTGLFHPTGHTQNGQLKILSVGRIAPVKNYETLILACGLLKNHGLDFSVSLAGEPALKRDHEYLAQLKTQIEAQGLESQFRFLGRVDHARLPELYSEHNLFVHMSRTGSLDKTILEAIACGLTVVSSNDAARGFLPAEYCFLDGDSAGLAEAIMYASNNPRNFRDYVVSRHNLDTLINKIIQITNQ